MSSKDRYKTCVVTPWGLYNFKRLAMGLQNSAQSFQRLVDSVIGDMPDVYCYLDDILIYSKDQASHTKTLDELFKRLSGAGLSLNLSKCEFGQSQLDYLGYTIDRTGLKPIAKKIEALQNFPVPTTQKQLQAFLGSLNYYRASLPRLPLSSGASMSPAEVLDPLYKMATADIKKGSFKAVWEHNKRVQEAFVDAKSLLEIAVTLNYPDPNAPLAISTDASKDSLGASLDQWINGSWVPLGFWSKSLRPEQRLYTTYRRELLAIKLAIRHFISEIQGRHLTVYTDHRPILGSFASSNLQLHDTVALNAINEIAQHTSDIRYRPGKELLVPDMLSRPFGGSEPATSSVYVQPRDTWAAIAAVKMDSLKVPNLAKAQEACPMVTAHLKGLMPRSVKVAKVPINGIDIVCEVSDPAKPRPLIPERQRSAIVQLAHHLDHPGVKETTKRVACDYYWPAMRDEITQFVRSCHPCQMAKQSPTINPGVGTMEVTDERFTFIHLDVVGPLPESQGMKYLLSILDRTTNWLECYPMRNATSEECCKGFLEWVSRYGIPSVAMSDNGNTFVANLYQDIMKTFNVKVVFSPAYHQQANGAVERQHQNLKNSLRASIIEMGEAHKDQWMRALPWVLLGRRVAFQPRLDASSAQLVFGKAIQFPGALLTKPGPPLTKEQTSSLLDQLFKLTSRPAAPMSGKHEEKAITNTEQIDQVFVKNHGDQKSLSEKYDGPFPVISRPSRSRVEVKLGTFASGAPRTQVYSWSSCKPANLREEGYTKFRKNLGRKPTKPLPSKEPEAPAPTAKPPGSLYPKVDSEGNEVSSNWSPRPGPGNCNFGPVITKEMLDQWHKVSPPGSPPVPPDPSQSKPSPHQGPV